MICLGFVLAELSSSGVPQLGFGLSAPHRAGVTMILPPFLPLPGFEDGYLGNALQHVRTARTYVPLFVQHERTATCSARVYRFLLQALQPAEWF